MLACIPRDVKKWLIDHLEIKKEDLEKELKNPPGYWKKSEDLPVLERAIQSEIKTIKSTVKILKELEDCELR